MKVNLPLGTFVLKRNFTHVHFSDKPKPLRFGPYKILDRLLDVTSESQDGTTFHIHRNHLCYYQLILLLLLIPKHYYPKETLLYPHLSIFMRFSGTINLDIPKPILFANGDSSLFISDTSSVNLLQPCIHLILMLL